MSAESRKRYLEQSALREAQKAIDRHGRNAVSREGLACLRIQTTEPWKRGLLAILGLIAGVGGYLALTDEVGWLSVLLFSVGALLLIAAIFGVRRTVRAALDGVDPFQLFDSLF